MNLQVAITDCENLRGFQRWLSSAKRDGHGLVPNLAMRECDWKAMVGEKIRQHMLQFTTDKLHERYIKRWKVWKWIFENHPEGGRTNLELLQRCRKEVFPDELPPPRALYKIFNDLCFFFDGSDPIEEVESVFLLADDER